MQVIIQCNVLFTYRTVPRCSAQAQCLWQLAKAVHVRLQQWCFRTLFQNTLVAGVGDVLPIADCISMLQRNTSMVTRKGLQYASAVQVGAAAVSSAYKASA